LDNTHTSFGELHVSIPLVLLLYFDTTRVHLDGITNGLETYMLTLEYSPGRMYVARVQTSKQ